MLEPRDQGVRTLIRLNAPNVSTWYIYKSLTIVFLKTTSSAAISKYRCMLLQLCGGAGGGG